jgi:hypothetical protein
LVTICHLDAIRRPLCKNIVSRSPQQKAIEIARFEVDHIMERRNHPEAGRTTTIDIAALKRAVPPKAKRRFTPDSDVTSPSLIGPMRSSQTSVNHVGLSGYWADGQTSVNNATEFIRSRFFATL